jgi:hypothetical protein
MPNHGKPSGLPGSTLAPATDVSPAPALSAPAPPPTALTGPSSFAPVQLADRMTRPKPARTHDTQPERAIFAPRTRKAAARHHLEASAMLGIAIKDGQHFYRFEYAFVQA